jgi:hypothetical protein
MPWVRGYSVRSHWRNPRGGKGGGLLALLIIGGCWAFCQGSSRSAAPMYTPPQALPSAHTEAQFASQHPPTKTHCADPLHPPTRAAIEHWSTFRCMEPYESSLCLVRADYTDTVGMGCPGNHLCCGPAATTSASEPLEGTNPRYPVLPASDNGFVDRRDGWGWGDRCWTHLRAGKWGWAKAECDRGIALAPESPQPRASLLYNEGLIARVAGDPEQARRDFTESLALRANDEVRAALASLKP